MATNPPIPTNPLDKDHVYFRAVLFAARAHHGQMRKLGNIPFIIHPMAVAAFLAEYYPKQELIIAAILHDVVEDTTYNLDDIEQRFGAKVAHLVDGVSEQDKALSWKERKAAYYTRLQNAPIDVIRLSAADKYHNLVALGDFWIKEGDAVFDHFNADKHQTVAKYQELIDFYKMKQITWADELQTLLDRMC
ncbi:MAG: HD domain-containing protein [Promethearchaeota archaeon]